MLQKTVSDFGYWEAYLPRAVKILLFATALTPLVFSPSLLFPFIFGKALFFRVLVELTLVLFFVYIAVCLNNRKSGGLLLLRERISKIIKQPLFLAISFFFIASAGISTLFASNIYRAFWGDIERSEGLFGFLHYAVFFALAVVLFKKSDWLRFFVLSIGVGTIVFFYAWLQYFGITHFPFAFPLTSQPGSFLGNPAYVAEYAILLMGLAIVLFAYANKTAWKYYAFGAFIALAILTIFLTQVRGAILGLAMGVLLALFFFIIRGGRKRIGFVSVRITAVVIVIILFASTAGFWATRTADVWQTIPGVRRFAMESYDISSVTTRLMALGSSWKAFKERPLIGWGPENYNVAYNKHYNPSYAVYAEDWFDRAHNKVAEVMVTQGALGVASYLVIFIFLIAILAHQTRKHIFLSFSLGAILLAYFIQNLFLFDQIASYIPFLALCGFLVATTVDKDSVPEGNVHVRIKYIPRVIYTAVLLSAVAVLSIVFYFYNYIPAMQMRAYIKSFQTRDAGEILASSDTFLWPYNFAQATIRMQFASTLRSSGLFRDTQFRPLTDTALAALEEVVAREPYEPRHFAVLVEGYSEYAKDDPIYLATAEMYARQGLSLSPNRQGLLYYVASTLADAEKFEEAIEVSERAVALDTRVYKSHYKLAVLYSLSADPLTSASPSLAAEYRSKGNDEFDVAWRMAGEQNDYQFFSVGDFNNFIINSRSSGNYARAREVLNVVLDRYPDYEQFYLDAIAVYRALRDAENLIMVAEKLQKLNPALKTDLDSIIELARAEKWATLDTF